MSIRLPSVVTSLDGQLAVQVIEYEGLDSMPMRDASGAYFTLRLAPTAAPTRIGVLFSGTSVRFSKWEAFGLPTVGDPEERLGWFGLAAMGEHLDNHGIPPSTPSGVNAFQIECFSPTFNAWERRPRASDEIIQAYLESKLYWGWKYDQIHIEIARPDFLRLRASLDTVKRVAQIGSESDWTWQGVTDTSFILAPTSSFLRRHQGRHGSTTTQVSSGQHLLAQLQAPRYAGTREHWLKALDFAHGPKRDLANAAKEAVCAVEGMARLLAKDDSSTLGELVKSLKLSGKINPAVAKSLEALWGYTSNEPGVRHGSPTPPTIGEDETQFVLDSAHAALRLLLEQDR